MHRMNRLGLLALGALALGACDLNLQDPNLPTEQDVTSTRQGLTQVAVGVQAEYSNGINDLVYVTGEVTNEIGAGGATFQSYQILDSGAEPLDNNLGPSEAPWTAEYRVVRDANVLLQEVPGAGFGPGTTSGILALAETYKAMAFGGLLQIFERIPITVGPDHPQPQFASRTEALDTVIALLQSAATRIQQQAPSSDFNNSILAPGLDLPATIQAMLARYALIAGQYDLALQAAQSVDLSVLSQFEFSANDQNPLYNMWYASGNAYQMRPKDSFRLNAEPDDQRVGYWVVPADIQGAIAPLDDLARYTDAADAYPAYLPDEMLLIQAEVYARNNDLTTAIGLVNQVRTRCTSTLDVPSACLPAFSATTQGDVLAEILHERAYSLYLQGVRWSDLRRFGVTPKFTFMNVPQSECDRNQNVPQELCGSTLPNPQP